MYGSNAENREYIKIKNIMEHGIVKDYNSLEGLYHTTFYNELRIEPEEHSVTLTEALFTPETQRKAIGQMMFETFNVRKLYFAMSGPLSLYVHGDLSGLCFESGHGVTTFVPVIDGYELPLTMKKYNFGGCNVDQYFEELLMQNGYYYQTSSERRSIQVMKEKLCFVSRNYKKELESENLERSYELPDGSVVSFSYPRFEAPEIMFDPSKIGYEYKGVHETIHEIIQNTSEELQKYLCENIIISGGNTRFEGFVDRLIDEFTNFKQKYQVNALLSRRYNNYMGASMLSGLSSFQSSFRTISEYCEKGLSIFNN